MDKDLANYFKNNPGFNRLFVSLKTKYISLGRYSGSIKLSNITKEESLCLSNFYGRKIAEHENFQTSFTGITKVLSKTKYKDFTWEGLFKYYFPSQVITKETTRELSKSKEQKYFQAIIDMYDQHPYTYVLKDSVASNNDLYRLLKQKYHSNSNLLKQELSNIFTLLDNMPNTIMTLPVYASLTGNPHFLDLNTSSSNLFFRFLSIIKGVSFPTSHIAKINLLSEINVYTDPLSNYVITYKLIGDPLLDIFSSHNQVLNLNLNNITTINNIDTKYKKVYIFENPSILNTLSSLEVPIVITSGIPNLAFYKLVEKLLANHNQLYYNGDCDPEGLIIASKLKQRYTSLQLMCYDKEDYQVSGDVAKLSDSRLKKISGITEPDLIEIKNILLETKIPAYQEQNIRRIEQFIKERR